MGHEIGHINRYLFWFFLILCSKFVVYFSQIFSLLVIKYDSLYNDLLQMLENISAALILLKLNRFKFNIPIKINILYLYYNH